MKLYIIRHGQTKWNSSYRLQGQTDIPLNENGRELAKKTGKALARQGICFEYVFTSPLTRARETAELVLKEIDVDYTKNDSSITEDPRIQEISFGKMEGARVRDENGVLTDPNFSCFFQDTEHYLPPEGAESFEILLARTGDFLEDMKNLENSENRMNNDIDRNIDPNMDHDIDRNVDGNADHNIDRDINILVSTHGAASRALLANITHCPLSEFWSGGVPKNCAVTIVDLADGEWKIKEQDILYYGNENI